jgi:hypothetical protein
MAVALAGGGVPADAILCARAENGGGVRTVESFLPPADGEFSVVPAADDATAMGSPAVTSSRGALA